MSFINSCIINFLLILLGKLNVLPICNKLETFGGFELEGFMNHFISVF